MHQAQGRHHVGVREFLVEMRNLRRQQQAFVHDGPGRERRHVEKALVRHVGLRDLDFGPLADDAELAFELLFTHAGGAPDENLLDVGLGVARHSPYGGPVDRRVAPAEDRQAFLPHDTF